MHKEVRWSITVKERDKLISQHSDRWFLQYPDRRVYYYGFGRPPLGPRWHHQARRSTRHAARRRADGRAGDWCSTCNKTRSFLISCCHKLPVMLMIGAGFAQYTVLPNIQYFTVSWLTQAGVRVEQWMVSIITGTYLKMTDGCVKVQANAVTPIWCSQHFKTKATWIMFLLTRDMKPVYLQTPWTNESHDWCLLSVRRTEDPQSLSAANTHILLEICSTSLQFYTGVDKTKI